MARAASDIRNCTNMSNLSYELARNIDETWRKQDDDGDTSSFVERCKRLISVERIRARVFDRIPQGLRNCPGWREACVRYRNSLPQ